MNKLLLGFTTGLIVGILFAPDSGSATRKRITRAGKDIKDKFNDLIDGLVDSADEFADDVDHFADKAKASMK